MVGIVIDVVASPLNSHVRVNSSVVEGGRGQGPKIWFVFFGDGSKVGLFTLQFHSWWLRAEIRIGHGFFFF